MDFDISLAAGSRASRENNQRSRSIQRRATLLFEFGLPFPPWMSYTLPMKMLFFMAVAAIAVLVSACGPKPRGSDRLKNVVQKSEYVLLCDTDKTGQYLQFNFVKVLHLRPGASVPFSPGDSLGHYGTIIEDGVTYPDRAAIIFEKIGGQVRMSSINSIYDSTIPNSDYNISDFVTSDDKK